MGNARSGTKVRVDGVGKCYFMGSFVENICPTTCFSSSTDRSFSCFLSLYYQLIFLPPTSRAAVGILICVVCCCTLNYFQPHRNKLVLFVSQMSFLMSTFKYVCAVFLRINDDLNDADRNTMGWILVALDLVFMLASAVTFVLVIVLLRAAIVAEAIKGNNEGVHKEEQGSSSVKVAPLQRDEAQQQQQRSSLRQEIVALRWQKNIRHTLMKNTTLVPKASINLSRVKSTRTRTVEEIEKNHQNHRDLALKNIAMQHTKRRSSLQMRVQARNIKSGGVNKSTGNADTAVVVEKGVAKVKAAAPTLDMDYTQRQVATLRVTLAKLLKTPATFQKWMTQHDKASSGWLSRVDFVQLIGKVVQRMGKGAVQEKVMDAMWGSAKEGSGEGVAWDVVEHEVVKQWVFRGGVA